MRHFRSCVFVMLMASSSFSWGVDCKRAVTQVDMDYCNDRALKQLDRELNRAYRGKMSMLPANAQSQLRKEQRVWIRERDTRCARVWRDGIWDKPVWERISCESEMTKQRAEEIKNWQPK
jgi:uncharacterized protein YecT (DUF1311 family)